MEGNEVTQELTGSIQSLRRNFMKDLEAICEKVGVFKEIHLHTSRYPGGLWFESGLAVFSLHFNCPTLVICL